ncbi:polysulfide reductase NrfD [Micromonospora sonneratiae]|uniref:NrfD/PsrC family molybdoenzyme membrane anchor subunit n=1 Tax=Micromonospora sonneratiae TaxID=1184706 RepID=A0ABW3YAB2_9ACTN
MTAPGPHPDGGQRRRERDGITVPPARFQSYYGRPIIKAPVWRWDIPAYLFTGGLAAGTAMLAAGADLTDRPALRRSSRLAALGAVGASTYFLIHDLGRPERFHHMLRVAKPTSPMSVGTWILAAFGPAAGAAAVSEFASWLPQRGPLGLVRRVLPPAGRAAGVASAVVAPALATYTGVLLADTAVPSWHDAYPYLPFVFSGSALAGATGLGLIATPTAENRPVRRLAVVGAGIELVAGRRVERMGLTSEPYHTGPAGLLLRAGRALLVAGTVGAVLGRRSRIVSALSGAALLASSAMTRFAVFQAGLTSARDPRYTVVPQRERRDREKAPH